MLVVRLASPSLRGVGWFSAAFAAGSFAAGLLLVPAPFANIVLADVALLGSFFLLQIAVLQLAPNRATPIWKGFVVLGLQATMDLFAWGGLTGSRPRLVCLGLLVAIQTVATAWTQWPLTRGSLRAPAIYSNVLLLSFGGFNILRSFLITTSWKTTAWNDRLSFLVFPFYLAVALGLAFGFFWMTTATLAAQLAQAASTDPLTRIPNRRVFQEWCEKELLRSQRSGIPFSVLMVDLDHFKRINDNFGHHRGDEVLCAAVERMQDSLRGIDILCRWGGEEFAVLLPNAAPEATRLVAERMRENIERMNVPLGLAEAGAPEGARLTVSIGAATYGDREDGVAAMLLRADRALYRAKASGRNQVLVAA